MGGLAVMLQSMCWSPLNSQFLCMQNGWYANLQSEFYRLLFSIMMCNRFKISTTNHKVRGLLGSFLFWLTLIHQLKHQDFSKMTNIYINSGACKAIVLEILRTSSEWRGHGCHGNVKYLWHTYSKVLVTCLLFFAYSSDSDCIKPHLGPSVGG